MLNSRKSKVIISLLVAIVLWAYVISEMDPSVKKTYRNITIKYENEQTLVEKGLAVASVSETNMSVTLSGKRSTLSRLDSSDISATVDLSNAVAGTNELSVEMDIPSKAEATRQSVSKITVRVEPRVSEKKDVRVSYLGDYTNGEEPTTIALDPSTVTVSGAKSLVNKVSYVRATVSKKRLSQDAKTITSQLKAMDSSGYEVKNVTLSQSTVRIDTALYKTKSVKLNVPVTDDSGDEDKRTYDAPDHVTVKGPVSKLDNLETVKAEDIDISNVNRDTTIRIKPILPSGVKLAADSENLELTVNVKNGDYSKDLTFQGSDVSIKKLDSDFTAEIQSNTITVTVTGSASQLEKIDSSDINLSVNVAGLEEGTHELSLEATCDRKYSDLTVEPTDVSVIITKK